MAEYNLYEYLRTHLSFSGKHFTVNGIQSETPDTNINISGNGGPENPNFDRKDLMISIVTTAIDKPKSRSLSYLVYDTINKKFGLTLPAVTVDGESFPAVKTWQIIGLAVPDYIGNDDNGRPMFAANYKITTE